MQVLAKTSRRGRSFHYAKSLSNHEPPVGVIKITQILRNYTKAAIAQITNFKYFTKVANGI